MTELQDPPHPVTRPIDLRLPADPAMAKVLRLAASGVVSLYGYDVDEIEEVKLAASEVLIALVEHGAGEAVDVRFLVSDEEVRIDASTTVGRSFDIDHPDLAMCRVVLDDVCTEHRLVAEGSELRITATLRRPFRGV